MRPATGPSISAENRAALAAELEVEQRYVDRVYARLDQLVERARQIGEDGRARGLLDYTGEIKEEDYRGLFERDVMVDHAVRRLALLDAQREGLVFGRLDQRDRTVRYVGRIGIRDEDQEPLVIDWRAPAAAVFYQATPVRPMGVVRRRVLRSRGQEVVGIEDDLLDADAAPDNMVVIGDGALMAALSAARGPQMRDIVATIQREQDEIIRAPSRGATLISGGPGTGKTVVALHRAAYLLYSERQRIAGGGVLVVGPSPVFMTYIERVLPSLGEHDATLRSLGEVHDGVVATRSDPFEVAVVKGSLRMRTVLLRAMRETPPDAPKEFRIYAAGRVLRLDARELAGIRTSVLSRSARHNPSRRDAVQRVLDALWRKTDRDVPRRDFGEDVGERDEFTRFVAAWWPVLTPLEVFARLRDESRLAAYCKGVLRQPEVRLLASTWGEEPSVQDVPLIDELYDLLGPAPRPEPRTDELAGVFDEFMGEVRSLGDQTATVERDPVVDTPEQYDGYAHVLVDEAQDLSPMQ
ncbi:MAG TPA: ATP-dependent DNA helicase, partial [Actinopolymorphaceae bacterium]